MPIQLNAFNFFCENFIKLGLKVHNFVSTINSHFYWIINAFMISMNTLYCSAQRPISYVTFYYLKIRFVQAKIAFWVFIEIKQFTSRQVLSISDCFTDPWMSKACFPGTVFVGINHGKDRVPCHYNDVIMSVMASQITSPTIVNSIVYSGAYQRKHQSSASLAFARGIHRTRRMFSFGDVVMRNPGWRNTTSSSR